MGQWVTLNVNTETKQPDRVAWFAYDWRLTKADKDMVSLTTSIGALKGQQSTREDIQRATMAMLTQQSESVWRVSIRILGVKISGFEQTLADKVDTLADACPNLGAAKTRAIDEMKRLGYVNERGLWTGDPPIRWYIDGNMVILKESEIVARFNKSSQEFLDEVREKKRQSAIDTTWQPGMTDKERAIELERRASKVKAKPRLNDGMGGWVRERDFSNENWRRAEEAKIAEMLPDDQPPVPDGGSGAGMRFTDNFDYWQDVFGDTAVLSKRELEMMSMDVKTLTEGMNSDDFIWIGDECFRLGFSAAIGSTVVKVYRQRVAKRSGLAIFPRKDKGISELKGVLARDPNAMLIDCQPLNRFTSSGDLVATGSGVYRAAANHNRGATLLAVYADTDPNLRGLTIEDRRVMEDRLRSQGRTKLNEEELRWLRSRYRTDMSDVQRVPLEGENFVVAAKPFVKLRRVSDEDIKRIEEAERRAKNLASLKKANERPSDTREWGKPVLNNPPTPEQVIYEAGQLPGSEQRALIVKLLTDQGFDEEYISEFLALRWRDRPSQEAGDGIIPERYIAGHDDEDAV